MINPVGGNMNKLKKFWNNPENWKPYDWGIHRFNMDSQQLNTLIYIAAFIFIAVLFNQPRSH